MVENASDSGHHTTGAQIKWNWILQVVTALVLLAGGVYAFGQFNGQLATLEKRVDQLETRVDPIRALRVARGDLCLEILKQQSDANNARHQDELDRKWAESGCQDMPARSEMKTTPR